MIRYNKSDHLARLSLKKLHKRGDGTFDNILSMLSRRIPGVSKVEAKTTEEGRVLLPGPRP